MTTLDYSLASATMDEILDELDSRYDHLVVAAANGDINELELKYGATKGQWGAIQILLAGVWEKTLERERNND